MIRTTGTFENKAKLITRRMFVLSVTKAAVFIAIISRLLYLQVSENIKYKSLSDKNRLREWKVPPRRGIIEDFFGNKIAGNTQLFQLHMVPEDVPNIEELLFKLSKLITFNDQHKLRLLKKSNGARTVPQIFIDDYHVGGNKELQTLNREGKLNSLLGI